MGKISATDGPSSNRPYWEDEPAEESEMSEAEPEAEEAAEVVEEAPAAEEPAAEPEGDEVPPPLPED